MMAMRSACDWLGKLATEVGARRASVRSALQGGRLGEA